MKRFDKKKHLHKHIIADNHKKFIETESCFPLPVLNNAMEKCGGAFSEPEGTFYDAIDFY